ncbi:MAG: hypothetical protein KJ838_00705, partial [Candidatus Omnitrophica bacterium]|nr:hypothetical protein [Candidatus Omnitrophota bacterium]
MKTKSFFVSSSILIGLIVGLVIAARFDFSPPADTKSLTAEKVSSDNFQDAVVNVADTTGKAVVSISTEYVQRLEGADPRYYFRGKGTPFEDFFGGDDLFQRFFDDFFGEGMPQ